MTTLPAVSQSPHDFPVFLVFSNGGTFPATVFLPVVDRETSAADRAVLRFPDPVQKRHDLRLGRQYAFLIISAETAAGKANSKDLAAGV